MFLLCSNRYAVLILEVVEVMQNNSFIRFRHSALFRSLMNDTQQWATAGDGNILYRISRAGPGPGVSQRAPSASGAAISRFIVSGQGQPGSGGPLSVVEENSA